MAISVCDESAVSEMNESMVGGDAASSRALLAPPSALDKDKGGGATAAPGASGTGQDAP